MLERHSYISGEEQARVWATEKHIFNLAIDPLEWDADPVDVDITEEVKGMDTVSEMLGGKQPENLAPKEVELEPMPVLQSAELMPMSPEAGDKAPVLRQAGFNPTGWFVDARGTGELRVLPTPSAGCIWAQGVSENGAQKRTWVAEYNEETKVTSGWRFVEDMFRLRLHRANEAPAMESHLPDADRGFLIADPQTNSVAYRSEQRRAKTARGVSHYVKARPGMPDAFTIHVKLWIFQFERAPGMHLMWELPRLAGFLHRSLGKAGEKASNWYRNNLGEWPKIVQRWPELGDGHYMRGHKGMKKEANDKNKALPAMELAQLISEPLATSIGVTMSVLHFAAPLNDHLQHQMAPQEGAKAPSFMCLTHFSVGLGALRRGSGSVGANGSVCCSAYRPRCVVCCLLLCGYVQCALLPTGQSKQK